MNSFVKKIKTFAFHNNLFSKGERVLIGISGGPDSVCLSRVLLELKEAYELELALMHVNYGLRGSDSDKDEGFVRAFAKENKLPLEVVYYQKDEKLGNLEEDMRNFRYIHFEKFAKKEGFDKIALAHNCDDQVETFLMNLFRGSGTAGLSAMRVKRSGIVRPLLFVSKEEILDFLDDKKQAFRIDKSNEDQKYTRNRIRASLLPILKEYNPQIKSRIFQLTENLQDEFEIVEEIVEKKYNDIVKKEGEQYSISVTNFLSLSVGLRKLLFRRILHSIKGDLRNVSANNFFEFSKILKSEKSKNQQYFISNVEISRKGDRIIFVKKKFK